jgi:hypothetical protein
MAGSPGDEGPVDPTVTKPAWTHPPTQPGLPNRTAPAFPADTVTGLPADTVTSLPPGGSRGQDGALQPASRWPVSGSRPQEIVRHGPGVPASTPVSQAGPTAEEVWRTGLPGDGPRPKSPLRRLAGPVLTVVLLIASVVVIITRLHHASFGVTGVAITQQVKSGCTDDVTGRIGTTGGAGTVSYEWTFQPQRETPQPQSQTVTAGQTSVYVTAAVEGQGQGTLAQTATLQVLGPGQDSASARIVVSC